MTFSATSVELEHPVAVRRPGAVAAFAIAVTLFAAACGGSSDDSTDTSSSDAAETASPAVEPESDAASPAVSADAPADDAPDDDAPDDVTTPPADCLELDRARQRLSTAGSLLFNVEDAEQYEAFELDTDSLLADIESFRPYQDVDAVPFGPIREGLDNLEHDLIAAREGRFADMIRNPDAASRNGLIVEICS